MLSKNQIRFVTRLNQKKYRLEEGCFVVEGVKAINEILQSNIELLKLYTTESFKIDAKEEVLISEKDLKRISFFKTPNKALAVFKIPTPKPIKTDNLIVALDDVRDPGNLGTIIRLCDWFGIKDLVCSNATVDCYNPKVIQATMGSITRVNISYVDLNIFLSNESLPILGTFMDGDNIYKTTLPQKGIIVMGNEANGISKAVENKIERKITIPRFGNIQATESLNVATATAVVLSEFRREI